MLTICISDVPSTPKGPLVISEVTETSCSLKWKPSEKDGGKPITKYVIELRESKRSTWSEAGSVEPKVTEFKPKRLMTGNEYYFRVKAVNEEGDSAPLEGTEIVAPKKKIGKKYCFSQS